MQGKPTKEKILDAAELLFGTRGYHNTSLRHITAEARTNIASVNYYFGSKEALFGHVLARRLTPLNEQRLERLRAIETKCARGKCRPGCGETLGAFILPTLHFARQTDGGRNFIVMVSRILAEPDEALRQIFLKHMKEVFAVLSQLLQAALPDVPQDILQNRLMFSLGAMAHALILGEHHSFLTGKTSTRSNEDFADMLLAYVTAGMEAPV